MNFNKQEYWENRKDGKRGQGTIEHPAPSKEFVEKHMAEGTNILQVGGRITHVSRHVARRKAPASRIFYSKDDNTGKKHTQKGAVRSARVNKFHPSKDPNSSNHERLLRARGLKAGR